MNDLISRQAAIDLFPNDALEWDTNGGYIAPHFARRMIEELPSAQPTVDAIPISFIEEMKAWAEENDFALYASDLNHLLLTWAERKEE